MYWLITIKQIMRIVLVLSQKESDVFVCFNLVISFSKYFLICFHKGETKKCQVNQSDPFEETCSVSHREQEKEGSLAVTTH